MQKYYGLDSHHCYVQTNQTANKYGTTRANISTVIDELGIQYTLQSSNDHFFTVVGLLVEHITTIAKPKVSLEGYPSIG